ATTVAYTLAGADVGSFVCVVVTADDGVAAAVSANSVTAIVVKTNGPIPANGSPYAATTNEDTPLTIPLATLFTDNVAGPNALSISNVGTASIAGSTVVINGTNVEYTPLANWNSAGTYYAPDVLAAGTIGADSFTVSVTDGIITSTLTVNVTVNAVVDVPVPVADVITVVVGGAVDVFANDSNVDPVSPVTAHVINGSWKWAPTSATAGNYVYDSTVMPFFDSALNTSGAAWPAGGVLSTVGSTAKTYNVEYKIAQDGTTEGWNVINYNLASTYVTCDSGIAGSTANAPAVSLFEDYGIVPGDVIKIRTTGYFHASIFSYGAISTGLGGVFSSMSTIPQDCAVLGDRFETTVGDALTSTALPHGIGGNTFTPQGVASNGAPQAPNSFEVSPTFVESLPAWGGTAPDLATAVNNMLANNRKEYSVTVTVPDPNNATNKVYLYFMTQDADKSDNGATLNSGTANWPLKIEIIKVSNTITADITVIP
ncbi:MAG: hypothetical protein Q9M19_02475, partial [Mariprofundaceae bacterium]|nr:hypothetical protein [Mariprofundaceae bacterium]